MVGLLVSLSVAKTRPFAGPACFVFVFFFFRKKRVGLIPRLVWVGVWEKRDSRTSAGLDLGE